MTVVLSSGPSPYAGLWNLDPEITFLNHGSFGACPRAILARQQQLRDAMEAEPVRFMEWEYPLLLDVSRRKLAQFTGCDPSRVVFTRSVTQAVNSVLRSFPFEEGDEIVSTDHEYNACANVARYLADGLPNVAAKVRFIEAKVPYPVSGPDDVFDAVMKCITPRTRLLLIDQVTSPSGFLQPVAELVEEMNRRGIETLVDGSHSVGMIPLELDRLGATFFTSNCHKWLCTPKGSGMLHVREDWIDRIYPSTISHGYNWKCPQFNALQNEFDWPGTDDFTPWLCVGDTIDYFEKILGDYGTKLERLRQYNHELVVAARRLLCERLNCEPVCPESMLTSIAAVSLPPENKMPTLLRLHPASGLHPLHIRLLTQYAIEVPVYNWRQWPDLTVRVSAQLYNDLSQYEHLADVLCEILNL